MTIEWKDSYKIVGNAAIDAKHKVWSARINSIPEATDRGSLRYYEGYCQLASRTLKLGCKFQRLALRRRHLSAGYLVPGSERLATQFAFLF